MQNGAGEGGQGGQPVWLGSPCVTHTQACLCLPSTSTFINPSFHQQGLAHLQAAGRGGLYQIDGAGLCAAAGHSACDGSRGVRAALHAGHLARRCRIAAALLNQSIKCCCSRPLLPLLPSPPPCPRLPPQYYELVVYTSQLPTYADPILDRLDPQRLIQYRWVGGGGRSSVWAPRWRRRGGSCALGLPLGARPSYACAVVERHGSVCHAWSSRRISSHEECCRASAPCQWPLAHRLPFPTPAPGCTATARSM